MAERKRVGGLTTLDPAVQQWQAQAAENPATVTAKRRKDRQRVRIFVDISPELKAALERVAGWEHGEDTSVSQATELLLTWAALGYLRGEHDLRRAFGAGKTHARTPKFSWNVTIPDEWETELDTFIRNGKVNGEVDGKV